MSLAPLAEVARLDDSDISETLSGVAGWVRIGTPYRTDGVSYPLFGTPEESKRKVGTLIRYLVGHRARVLEIREELVRQQSRKHDELAYLRGESVRLAEDIARLREKVRPSFLRALFRRRDGWVPHVFDLQKAARKEQLHERRIEILVNDELREIINAVHDCDARVEEIDALLAAARDLLGRVYPSEGV